ncbi:MAG TPA: TIGR00730 family Rossman fold protein [Chloroflexaceae bacterium]|nr:TIGR00730 family Rossman fold protein [Chloroflexaceae bacterium]
MHRTICLYCGARPGASPEYSEAAAEFGTAVAERGWRLVYGGGNVGLMGVAARAALAGGGQVVGVIPRGLMEREQGFGDVTELIVTETLRERKGIMFERSDAFVALPGGFGTLEEVVETLTLRQLRYHEKPIFFLNVAGFFAPLLAFFDHAVAAGFVHPAHLGLFEVYPDVPALMDRLAHPAG